MHVQAARRAAPMLNMKTSPAVCHHLFASQADSSVAGFTTEGFIRASRWFCGFETPRVRTCRRTFLLSAAPTPRSLRCCCLFHGPLREQIKAQRQTRKTHSVKRTACEFNRFSIQQMNIRRGNEQKSKLKKGICLLRETFQLQVCQKHS